MKRTKLQLAAIGLLLLSLLSCALPSSALFRRQMPEAPHIPDFSKNGPVGQVIHFSAGDFTPADPEDRLLQITLLSLPDPRSGVLCMGSFPLKSGSVIRREALDGLCFHTAVSPARSRTAFTFSAGFPGTDRSAETEVTLYLLDRQNLPPIARNLELSTYKNIAVTGRFSAEDREGDLLHYRLTSTPARGSVSLSGEDGSFLYTPYENKLGLDSFSYVAEDSAGNTSPEARVTLRIQRPGTRVTYADLEGHPAHKAAIRLASEGLYIGPQVNGQYFFQPEQPVSRARFLTMAMGAVQLPPMRCITVTGFHDDAAIPAWAKGSVSAALKAGIISGSRTPEGAAVFSPGETVTLGEAAVMLDRLLNISDVPVAAFSPQGSGGWYCQSAANLAATHILEEDDWAAMSQPLTMGRAAQLLDGALTMRDGLRP